MTTDDDVPGDLVVDRSLTITADQLAWRSSRPSGPRGQGVNTTSSRVKAQPDAGASRAPSASHRQRLLPHVPNGVLTVVAADERSQWQTRRLAPERLRATLLAATAAPQDAQMRPIALLEQLLADSTPLLDPDVS
jgi:ribosome-associated protein